MRTRLAMIVATVLAAATASTGAAQPDFVWRPEEEKGWVAVRKIDDVVIYRRRVEGSRFPALLAHAHFDAPARAVFDVISDYDRFGEFIPSVVESRILRRQGACLWVYQRLRLSAWAAERAYVIRVSDDLRRIADGLIDVSWRLDEQASASLPRDGAVRPRRFSGSWHLVGRPGAASTEASYTIHVDPGGRLPAWLLGRKGERYVLRVMKAVRGRLGPDQGRRP